MKYEYFVKSKCSLFTYAIVLTVRKFLCYNNKRLTGMGDFHVWFYKSVKNGFYSAFLGYIVNSVQIQEHFFEKLSLKIFRKTIDKKITMW